ncbi:cyclase [Mycolicibacterium agri]|uniref:Cyclase n=1 Tax=Mycolicibacterium agri TaxID=36811 RepID=A0A2A7MTE3_MYCAG|nr:adenylate/guanylate cyclase domain-containing protein [Mycolicibacterium agri]PEG34995.1 cyclase [Mycolicibacterium agri]GFG54072.1 cyclase [Mycolicibacterium agri]
MGISCGVCSADLRDGARFCDNCGSPVATADRQAEYKQVTVLFADVVHSMDIAAAVGAERLREIMGEVFRRSSVIVQRYGGTVDKFTGDGIMAVFGAPVALEDHALRACRAALDIQADATDLATDVKQRDSIDLRLRIGLNSGEVITGDIGSGPLAYTAVGEQVGMAQRMESVAPPGGVMLSESTARLVEPTAELSEPELVHIKGSADPVPARRLMSMAAGRQINRAEPTFVGREWEFGALKGMLERMVNGVGCVVGIVGPPGIGKSRIVREITMLAEEKGVDVGTTICESHTADVPFHAGAGLLRSSVGVTGMDDAAARRQIRARFADAADDDLALLDDLLGIGDPDVALPQIDPDARRRRLAATVKAAVLARSTPVVYVIEDAHWIDEISESMLAELLEVAPRTRSMVIVTYRPEYEGALAHAPRSQTIALDPLDESQMRRLSTELLGEDNSVAGLTELITERAAGNPFFAEEIVRDLSERDVLIGGRGCYLCAEPIADVHVPSTLQAVIAARIDRLRPGAKRTLNAAAVIGSRFTPELLAALGVEAVVDDLVRAELIEQTAFGPRSEYAFRHPLVRAVAYESQLKSDRAQLHRRVADALDQSDQNAALIAEHHEAAGELRKAYEWHMRAGAWLLNRDHASAQLSWERALLAADALPADDGDVLGMRIAPRSLLCSNAFRRFHSDMSVRFEELRGLCTSADDKASLAIGMTGLVMEHIIRGRLREASQLASENMALIESIADPGLTVALSFASSAAKFQVGEFDDLLRWAQAAIDLAGRTESDDSIILGTPLAMYIAFRGVAGWQIGRPGWREDLEQALALSSAADAVTRSAVLAYSCLAIPAGALIADDETVAEIDRTLQAAELAAEDIALVLIRMTMGFMLVERRGRDVDRGYQMLAELCEICLKERYTMNIVPALNLYAAQQVILKSGDIDKAISHARSACTDVFDSANFANAHTGTAIVVEALLTRGSEPDLAEAELAIERLAYLAPCQQWAIRDVFVLRLSALVARARGDNAAYREFRDRYRAMAAEYGYEGHMRSAAELA